MAICKEVLFLVQCGGTTHVLRLNWSPDGQYLVSAHVRLQLSIYVGVVVRECFKRFYEQPYAFYFALGHEWRRSHGADH